MSGTKRRVVRNVTIAPSVDSDLKRIAERYTGGNVSRAVEMIVADYAQAEFAERPQWTPPQFPTRRGRQSAMESLERYRVVNGEQTVTPAGK